MESMPVWGSWIQSTPGPHEIRWTPTRTSIASAFHRLGGDWPAALAMAGSVRGEAVGAVREHELMSRSGGHMKVCGENQ